jgi:hypothetical protein
MTRLSVGTLLASFLAGTWGGCDRDPIAPPAAPPPERAPLEFEPPGVAPDVILLLNDARRLG